MITDVALSARGGVARSPLGFLEVDRPPTHYALDGRPVRRARVFLAASGVGGADGRGAADPDAAFLTCDDGGRPVARGFPVNGTLVPLGHLAGVVPEDVLWAETDLASALPLGDGPQRWWTLPVTLREEEATWRGLFPRWEGPPGSLSLTAAHDDFDAKAGALAEAVDPRGHRYTRQHCFRNYFAAYRAQEPFSGLRFFDWLDHGVGAALLARNDATFAITRRGNVLADRGPDELCHKGLFDRPRRGVHYFDDEERARHEVRLAPAAGGRRIAARYRRGDAVVPATERLRPHLYMWDLDRRLYVVDDRRNATRHGGTAVAKHSGVVAGRPALAAGEIHVGRRGTVRGIDFRSGHYHSGERSTAEWPRRPSRARRSLILFSRRTASSCG